MVDDRLFSIDEIPEVPIFREPRRVGARAANDQRFRNDYPPEWKKCTFCDGAGKLARDAGGDLMGVSYAENVAKVPYDLVPCPDCLGMGSLKARVRLEAGHRCIRCKHPYMPKGDAKMLGVERSGLHECETCHGSGEVYVGSHAYAGPGEAYAACVDCKGTGKVWTPWSACDEQCDHEGPLRVNEGEAVEKLGAGEHSGLDALRAHVVYAEWRILTVHHFDGDKANVRWWNLGALCQRCHLEIQAKVVMERIYPFEHSEWFRPYVAGYYAFVYLCGGCGLRRDDPEASHYTGSHPGCVGEQGMYPHRPVPLELSRPEVEERMDELLALELATA